jgi:hypothetical protein
MASSNHSNHSNRVMESRSADLETSEDFDRPCSERCGRRICPNGRNFVIMPLWLGTYSVLKRRSAMWDFCALFPQGDEFQRREIERIKAAKPELVVILDVAGRDDLRFQEPMI